MDRSQIWNYNLCILSEMNAVDRFGAHSKVERIKGDFEALFAR